MPSQVLERIREDHDLIRNILSEMESTPDTRDIRCITLRRELLRHMHAEEVTLYASLQSGMPEEIRQFAEDHARIREVMSRLEATPNSDDTWEASLRDLRGRVEAHFDAEEGRVLPRAEAYSSRDELFAMGERFEREKGTATAIGPSTI